MIATVRGLPRVDRTGLTTAGYIAITLFCWSSAFVAIEVAVAEFSPGSLVLFRFLVSSALVSILVVPRYGVRGFFRMSRGDFVRLGVMAIFGAVLYCLFLAHGQRTVSTFGASLLINTTPIWTAVLAGLVLRERLGWGAWGGVFLSFCGAIFVGSSAGELGLDLEGAVSILLAALCQGIYFVVLRSVVGRVGASRSTALTFLFATLATLPFAGLLAREFALASFAAVGAILYLGIVPGVLGVWSWSRAARTLPASRQAVFLYLVAPLTALQAWLVLGEVPSWRTALGGAVTIAGAAIVSATRSSPGAVETERSQPPAVAASRLPPNPAP